jgi:hypothetical protein
MLPNFTYFIRRPVDSFERPAAERPARSVASLEIGEPPRKILRPLDAARRFTLAGFAFLQSRHTGNFTAGEALAHGRFFL